KNGSTAEHLKVLKRTMYLKEKYTSEIFANIEQINKKTASKQSQEQIMAQGYLDYSKEDLIDLQPAVDRFAKILFEYATESGFKNEKLLAETKYAQELYEKDLQMTQLFFYLIRLNVYFKSLIVSETEKIYGNISNELEDVENEELTMLEIPEGNLQIGKMATILISPCLRLQKAGQNNNRKYINLTFKIDGQASQTDYESSFFEENGFLFLRFVPQKAGKYEISGQVETNYLWRKSYTFDHGFVGNFEVKP
ncbi:MAG: hypothetical protein EAZ97_01985, partial [Bacteroidetes bacterium]